MFGGRRWSLSRARGGFKSDITLQQGIGGLHLYGWAGGVQGELHGGSVPEAGAFMHQGVVARLVEYAELKLLSG